MKLRFLPLSALLLALPLTASAASELCVRMENLSPVSMHYTEAVLQRANRGIAYAREAAANPDFGIYFADWSRSILSSVVSLIDTELRTAKQQENLIEQSACLRVDLFLVECKMEEVREELGDQLERGSWLAIMRLQSVLAFLNERYAQLLRGSLDPTYSDPTWNQSALFDREPLGDAPPMCPFHSDYAPAFPSGYGCDSVVLSSIHSNIESPDSQLPFVQAELESSRMLEEAIDQYRRETEEILDLQRDLEEIFGRSVDIPELRPREHRQFLGCSREGTFCSDDFSQSCRVDSDCGGGRCIVDSERLRTKKELRGPFSVGKNEMELIEEFLSVRVAQGLSREQADALKTPEEFGEGEDAMREEAEEEGIFSLTRGGLRQVFRSWNRIQGQGEAATFPVAADPQLQIAASLSSLRDVIGELARLSSEKEGVRSFVTDLAYFARRSCIHRPCNALLDQVLKIGFTDACFPYTDGAFLDDTEENPRWQKCRNAAQISGE